VRALVLRAQAWQLDLTVNQVHFGPQEITDLRFALTGEKQQADNATVVIVKARSPDIAKLSLTQNSLPTALRYTPLYVSRRISFGVAVLVVHCPEKEAAKRNPGRISRTGPAGFL
jgi:hypothetical protein